VFITGTGGQKALGGRTCEENGAMEHQTWMNTKLGQGQSL
jgi:hypothetical protein